MRSLRLLLLALVGGLATWGQGVGRLPVRAFGIREGLESTTINSLVQDERGLIWVGTEAGLHGFDGRSFHPVLMPLPSRLVVSLLAQGNRLWIGTRNGMALRVGDRPQALPAGLAALDATISDLQAGPHDQAWFLANGQPWFATETKAAPLEGWPADTNATGLYVDPDLGRAFACSATRLWTWSNGQWQGDAPVALASGDVLQGVALDREGWMWLRSAKGLWFKPPAGSWLSRGAGIGPRSRWKRMDQHGHRARPSLRRKL
jgi:ligand-binding sensor domain-containing protein